MFGHENSQILQGCRHCYVQMIGSVEDEICLSTLAFKNTKLRNRFNDHLDLVVYMFAQKFYNLENFPYNVAIQSWKSIKV